MRKVLLVLAVLVGVAALGAWFEPSHVVRGKLLGEPFFEGRPASYWESRLASDDPKDQDEGPRKLRAGASDATPVLVALSHSSNASVRVQAAGLLGKSSNTGVPAATDALLDMLKDPDPFARQTAARALGDIHPDDPRVIPALIAELDGPDKATALRPLSQYGKAAKSAVPKLCQIMESDPESEVRWNAIRTLGKIGPDARQAVPLLIKRLKDEDNLIREHAAEALGDIGPADAAVAIPDLVPLVNDENSQVRRDAIRSLGQFGPAAKAAIPEIEKHRDDPVMPVRQAVEAALRRIDPTRPAPKGPTGPPQPNDPD
ncbi:MAG: HEAT repeat domain-containing protein [Gemmataceae bacterium]